MFVFVNFVLFFCAVVAWYEYILGLFVVLCILLDALALYKKKQMSLCSSIYQIILFGVIFKSIAIESGLFK